ncbi:uncharacterized protein (TIGR04255 family) [Bradyrhizobium sp. i1.15.2]|uniref:TIGR04255 family protein n=1 Tax=Bradyrhizobium sp. i1.15.2 TaxID=3156362 RepID=UPI003395DA5C
MKDQHPTYPNPTIAQVACEIAFATTNDEDLNLSALLNVLGKDFPSLKPVQNLQLQIVLGGPPPVTPAAPAAAGVAFRFATKNDKKSVLVSKTNFVFQWNESYSGWAVFKDNLMSLWASCAPHLQPGIISKLGLRYTNRIPRSEEFPDVKDWIKATADIPQALLLSKDHFLGRIESSPLEANLRLVTLGLEPESPDLPYGSILFDIDRLTIEQFEPSNDAISEKLEFVHEDIWTAFDSASTDTLKSHLAGSSK